MIQVLAWIALEANLLKSKVKTSIYEPLEIVEIEISGSPTLTLINLLTKWLRFIVFKSHFE